MVVSKVCDITLAGPEVESENFDREDMRLPGYQGKMLQDVINNGMLSQTKQRHLFFRETFYHIVWKFSYINLVTGKPVFIL